ncbi:MAG: isoprenylcysteine carboxylmethyltransferase family protein [Candidatus Micrarchaeota archaeon]
MGKLNKSGRTYLIKSLISPFFMGTMFFLAAGTLDLPRGWLFMILTAVYVWASAVIPAIYNPSVINERQEWLKNKGTKIWDWFFVIGYGIMQFYIQTIVMGLDVGRYFWSDLGPEFVFPGILLFLGSMVFLIWSMTENPHFEMTVRIQKERKHTVISTGPYAIVRHPGYVGTILWAFSGPFIVGSAIGFIPGALAAIFILGRTYMEDGTLQKELSGYKEYIKKVRYRLVPGIW